ncbi:MAG: FtsX-like permease family protein [Mycoplasmatales bacterium]
MLKKIVIKSLLKSKRLIIAISLLFTIAISLMTVGNFTFINLEKDNENFKAVTNQENFRIYLNMEFKDKLSNDDINEIIKTNNIIFEKHQLISIINNDSPNGNINRFDENNLLNEMFLIDGKLPSLESDVVISSLQANNLNLSVGDEYHYLSNKYNISGIAYFPEYTLSLDVITGTLPGSDFYPIYMNSISYDKLDASNENIYYSAKYLDEMTSQEKADLRKSIPKNYVINIPELDENRLPQFDLEGNMITKEIPIFTMVLDESINSALTGISLEIKADKTLFLFISQVIILLTSLLLVILFNAIFKSQKREMGILKVEGVSKKELSKYFCFYLGVILAICSIIGIVFGYFLSGGFTEILLDMYEFPTTIINGLDIIPNIVYVILLDVVLIIFVYFFAIRRNLKIKPILLVKNIETEKKPKFRIDRLTKNLSFKNKYKINILFRNIPQTLLLILGVLLSSFLLLFGTTFLSAINILVDDTYEKTFRYDYQASSQISFSDDQSEYSVINFDAPIVDVQDDTIDTVDRKIDVYAFDQNENSLIELVDEKGIKIPNSLFDDGFVVSSTLAKTYNLEIGDKVTIKNPYNLNIDLTKEVTAITFDGLSQSLYYNIDKIQSDFELDENYHNLIVGIFPNDIALLEANPTASIRYATNIKEQLEDSIKVAYTMIGIITIISSVIAFITISTISHLVISNNYKIISIMKVLGYRNKEIRIMTTSSYKWIILIVYFSSLKLIESLITFISEIATKDMDIAIPIKINLFFSLAGFLVIISIYMICMLNAQRSIKKIKLSESLKSDE